MPSNIESLLKRVEFESIFLYNKKYEGRILTGNIIEAIEFERNKPWNEEKCRQYRFSCEKLLQIIMQNKEEIPDEMFQIVHKTLLDIMKQVENIKGEKEL